MAKGRLVSSDPIVEHERAHRAKIPPYSIQVKKSFGFGDLRVRLWLPPLQDHGVLVRHSQRSHDIDVNTEEGTINIFASGDLHHTEIPHYLKALEMAQSLASGTIQFEDEEATEKKGVERVVIAPGVEVDYVPGSLFDEDQTK